MAFCIECGASLSNEVKFCPNCGTKTAGMGTPKKSNSNLEKGVAKGLKKNVSNPSSEIKNTVEEKIKETIKHKIEEESNDFTEKVTSSNNVNINYITLYIVANILVYLFGNEMPETQGLIIYSVLIFGIYLIFRRKKEKPFNWFLKVLLGLQLIFVIAILFSYATEGNSINPLLHGVLALFAAGAFLLIIRGNKPNK